MGWYKYKSNGKTITEVVAEQVSKKGFAKLLGKNEKVVSSWGDYKITKKSNYILYEQKGN